MHWFKSRCQWSRLQTQIGLDAIGHNECVGEYLLGSAVRNGADTIKSQHIKQVTEEMEILEMGVILFTMSWSAVVAVWGWH
eukprot:5839718-Amphidinium_carterae.1